MYELLVQDNVTEYPKRQDAVAAAKELTGAEDGPMTATISDGTETMNFRDGKLVAYTYETRKDRRGRSLRDRDEDDIQH